MITDQEKKELTYIYRNLLQKTLFRPEKSKKQTYSKQNTPNRLFERLEDLLFHDYHSRNVAYYCYEMGRELGFQSSECVSLFMGGMLHDIGKGTIPDSILFKPSKLTDEEYELVKQHSEVGYKILKNMLNMDNEIVLSMTLHHHERYDGFGYPHQLKGEAIPFVARIAAVADSFDAMTSNRPYRPKRKTQEAIIELRKQKGKQFDPMIVDLFVNMIHHGKIDVGLPMGKHPKAEVTHIS